MQDHDLGLEDYFDTDGLIEKRLLWVAIAL